VFDQAVHKIGRGATFGPVFISQAYYSTTSLQHDRVRAFLGNAREGTWPAALLGSSD